MRDLVYLLVFIGGCMTGAGLLGMWYEHRFKRALELEREREQAVRYGQIGQQDWGQW